ncbi:conserved hypothetical protein [Trichinella spiralis]|uniref:hypothetical protein n=1 Tax=Trichinella spiralis TaxID=6334 RepID=UPI0001EFC91A|nr:conserved hypothetical protein [Trichinella spiralis]
MKSSGCSGCSSRCATTIRTTGTATALAFYTHTSQLLFLFSFSCCISGAPHGSRYRVPGSAGRRVVQQNCQWRRWPIDDSVTTAAPTRSSVNLPPALIAQAATVPRTMADPGHRVGSHLTPIPCRQTRR